MARVKGLIRYLTYGHYIQDQNERAQERGVWFGPKRAYSYQEVLDWAKGSVHASEQPYGYTLLLSTRDGDLAEWEYEQALWAGNEWVEVTDWRLVVHEDTANQHAHALVFPREVIPTNLLHEWHTSMREALTRVLIEHQEFDQFIEQLGEKHPRQVVVEDGHQTQKGEAELRHEGEQEAERQRQLQQEQAEAMARQRSLRRGLGLG